MWFVGARQRPYQAPTSLGHSLTSLLSLLLSLPRALTATLAASAPFYRSEGAATPSSSSSDHEFELLDLDDDVNAAATAELIWKRLRQDAERADLLSLDPHVVQQATTPEQMQSLPQSPQDLDQHPCSSYHSQYLYHLSAVDLDPSLCLAFYLSDGDDFLDFYSQASRVSNSLRYSVFTLLDTDPGAASASHDDSESDFVML